MRGNVTISFPFGLILDGAVQTNCGAGGIGSKVRRYSNRSLYLEYSQSDINLQILSIFYDNRSLHITEHRHQHPYFDTSSHEGCQIPAADTSPVLAPPLSSVSPVNHKLIFYNCTKSPQPSVDLVEMVCHNNTFVRAANGRSDESGGYFLEVCTATMVPVLGVFGKVNATNYEQLVRDGFLATWQPPLPLPSLPGNFALGTKYILPNLSISLAGRGIMPLVYIYMATYLVQTNLSVQSCKLLIWTT
jgi:hypothetical protein